MKMQQFSRNQKIALLVGAIFVVVLPMAIRLSQTNQDSRSKASASTTLSFAQPSSTTSTSTVQATVGSTTSLDLLINPGTNVVSFIKAEIDYDPTKLAITNASQFQLNTSAFSQIVEGPVFSPGKMTITLSIGADPKRAITQTTKIGTVTFNIIADTGSAGTTISYGNSSLALAIGANANANENVLANKVSAVILASGQPPVQVCSTVATDTMLIIDKSGSMNDKVGSSGTKISNAIISANNFVDILAKSTQNNLGLVSFQSTSTLNSPLTTNYSSIKTQINSLTANGNTCIQCAIDQANQEIIAHGRSGIKKVVVLLTDGLANRIPGNNNTVNQSIAEQGALTDAKNGHNTSGTIFFTIGLGTDVNGIFLKQIADASGGQYYFSPTTDQLNSIYQQISQILAKGSINGTVFNDSNNNALFDSSEPILPGWIVQLFIGNSTIPQNYTSDSKGQFTISNLCDGTFTLKEVQQPGWKQTVPASSNGYTVNIANGSTLANENFGNYQLPKPRCSDTIDNDNNGLIDAQDPTCHSDGNPKNPNSYDPNKDGEHGGNTCADGKDNNNNGLFDGADPACHTDGNPNNPGSYDPNRPENARCSDGLDNDNNGMIDTKDSTCHTDGNPTNPNSYSPNKDGEHGGNTCDDGKDNNGNSLIDGADSTCHTDGNPNNPGSYDPNLPESSPTVTPIAITPTVIPTNTPTSNPTPTIQGSTGLQLNVLLHGIGEAGDNANPTANSLSNKTPLRSTRLTTVNIFNVNNQLVASNAGNVTYSSSSGSFIGSITLTTPLVTGNYNVKVSMDQHLTRLLPGIQTITAGQNNQMPDATLVTGDANNDNQLNILDYNMLLDCYSDLAAASNCSAATKKSSTDFNDDGQVNQFDYNLFLREISNQPGQ